MQKTTKTPHEIPTSGVSRRSLLAAAGAAAITIVPRHVLGGAGHIAPSNRLNIAVIGTGGQGLVNIRNLLQQPDVQIAAIADPNEESDYSRFYFGGTAGRLPVRKIIQEHAAARPDGSGKPCTDYIDYRVMLEKEKGIDAVLVATPDHLHGVVVMVVLQLRKHVYCEKPLCRTLYEVRKVVDAAREAKVATQMGNQGHSGDGIRMTCEWIWDGAIGPIREIHSWAAVNPWIPDRKRPADTPPIPAGLNWDLWLGPAAYRPYHPLYHPVTWRSWHDFGTAVLGDFACHHLDPAFWALKLGYPATVEGSSYGAGEETFPHAGIVYYSFPARGEMPPVRLTWYEGGIKPPTPPELEPGRKLGQDGHGILFVGEKGKIVCGGWGGTPRLIPESAMKAYRRPAQTLRRVAGHHRDWLDACKGGPPSSANFDAVSTMVESVLMGSIALVLGEKLEWDGPGMRCTNVTKANDWVKPAFRQGWSL